MKILQVFHLLPFPPDDGGRIAFWGSMKHLAKRHEVSIICMADGQDQASSIEELKKVCASVQIFRRRSSTDSLRLMRGVVLSPPGTASRYWHPGMGELIRESVRRWQPDIVEFQHLNTAAYRRFAGELPTVLREHNVEYKVWERFAEHATAWPERIYSSWCAPRVRRYEAAAAAGFDCCAVVSQADAVYLRAVAPRARIDVIPLGVDTEYFHPSPEIAEEPFSITLTGSFAWRPKQQSLLSLLKNVFPRIKTKVPEARFYVVGKGIPEELMRLGEETDGVTVVGPVKDVRPYVWRSSLMINYLESGGGIALKVLEAMAMRKSVLSNSLGCEGVQVEDGREVSLADGPEEFALAAARLLRDGALRQRIAEAGYRKAQEQYAWEAVVPQLERLYGSLLPRNSRRASEPLRKADSDKMVAIDD